MGIQSGSMSMTRYQYITKNKITIAKLNTNLVRYQSKKLRLTHSTNAEKMGWVLPDGIEDDLTNLSHWDMSHCQVTDGFLLKIRVEKKTVSPELHALIYRNRWHSLNKSKPEGVSRAEKKALKDEIRAELLSKSLPSISYIDAFWNTDTSEILLFTTSKHKRELFQKLFRETFTEATPGTLQVIEAPLLGFSSNDWLDPNQSKKTIDRLSLLVPVSFSVRK